MAAAWLGIDFIGVEMDSHYLAEAIDRTKAALAHSRKPKKSPDASAAPGLYSDEPENLEP